MTLPAALLPTLILGVPALAAGPSAPSGLLPRVAGPAFAGSTRPLSVADLGPVPEGGGDRFGRALLTLHDVDGDGVRDLAVGAPTASRVEVSAGHVLVLSGASREVLQVWIGEAGRPHFGHDLRSAGDVDGDGVGDVLVGYERALRTEVRSGANGALLGSFDRPHSQVHAMGDLDGDGAADVLLSGEHLEVRAGRGGALLGGHPWTDEGRPFHAVGDLDGDGLTDGVLAGDEARLLLTGSMAEGSRWSSFQHEQRFELSKVWPAPFQGEGESSPVPVVPLRAGPAGDLDGDGAADLVVQFQAGTRTRLWALSRGLSSEGSGPAEPRAWSLGSGATNHPIKGFSYGYSSWPAGDLDGDGAGDLLVGGAVGPFTVEVLALSGRTGQRLWTLQLDDGGASSGASVALLDDSDGDGVDEVVVGTCDWWWHGPVLRSGRLRCFSGASGKPLWELGVDDVSIPEASGR